MRLGCVEARGCLGGEAMMGVSVQLKVLGGAVVGAVTAITRETETGNVLVHQIQ